MIIYFSGTGNSKYVAEFFADKLGDELVDAGPYIKEGRCGEFTSDKPYVFVSPTYCWQLPHIFRDFIFGSTFKNKSEEGRSANTDEAENPANGGGKAYFVMTCGSDIGSAGKHNAKIAAKLGLEYMGTLEVIMPENYVAMFPVPGEEESARIVEAAKADIEGGIRIIQRGTKFREAHSGPLNAFKSGPLNPMFYGMAVKAKPFYTTDACVSCGKCVEECVLNNIKLGADGKPVWGDKCTHCMACICGCPAEAIEYGKKSQGKPRYKGPVYGDRIIG